MTKTYLDVAVTRCEGVRARMANNRWMAELPPRLTNVPLTCLAIPGSHNSGASDLDPALGVGVDQSVHLRRIGNNCYGHSVYHNWSRTQNLSIADQLEAGIRYLDFRVAVHPRTKEFRFIHGLYGGIVSHALSDIATFLRYNTKEVIIMDFNHFYNMTQAEHEMLLSELVTKFGHMVIPKPFSYPSHSMWGTTLQALWATPYRVIPIYQHPSVDNFSEIWTNREIESPWSNTNNVNTLMNFLENNYTQKHRYHNDTFYNWQGILTPRTKDIVLHPSTSLHDSMSGSATQAFVNWLQAGKVPGPREINICTSDFVEEHNFIPTVLGLNDRITTYPEPVASFA